MYLILALIGAISGALIARKRKGKVTDVLHYAFVYARFWAIGPYPAMSLIVQSSRPQCFCPF